jgi:uncharacterized protein YbaP (TraB family)
MNTRFLAFALLFFPYLFPQHADAQTAKSLLWEISGNGLANPSYLYGTMHVGDKRAHDFSDATLKAFNQSKAFAGELNMAEVDQLAVLNLMKLADGQKLKELFTADEWTRVETYCMERLRVNVNDFNDYNIFFVYSLIAQSQFKNQKGQAVDLYFFDQAREQSKKLLGLEKMEEQIAAINSMTIDEQKKMLLESVDDKKDKSGSEMKKMLKYYSKGDLDKLMALSTEADLGSNFETAFITDRNHRMAERMVPMMQSQSTFVAIGALHLPGEEGVIQLLRGMGYVVEPLN